jgi:protein tyrosine/serine phosphatase
MPVPIRTDSRGATIRSLKRSLTISALAIGLSAGSYGVYCAVIIYEGNFHAVEKGVLYRSAQLTEPEFERVGREYGIKSVLNLRGAHPGDGWYEGEMAAARHLGIEHFDYPISATRFVSQQQMEQILDIARRAPKPLLIHCQSGADRSGLVAAAYEYAIAGASAATADDQLSLYFGHFPYLASRSKAMDDSFWAFVRGSSRAGGQN